MDGRPIDPDNPPETEAPKAEAPQESAAEKPSVDIFAMPPSGGKEAWRSGSGCGPRMRIYLLLIGMIILVALLVAGLSVLRRGVWVTFEQGRRAVVQNLPADLAAGERERTMKNLDRFRGLLEKTDDPYPLMGEFMRRVRAAFDDSRLERTEVEELNLYLEQVIDESGVPPMQLGRTIRNEELGMRNAALARHRLAPDSRGGGNS
jgi:hypothetical protein